MDSSAAHPRSRGEHDPAELGFHQHGGSSPLARGTPAPPKHPTKPRRLIPARAGNTSGHQKTSRPFTAHPRSRGEHSSTEVPSSRTSGSSPLARGTLCGDVCEICESRLIPARAGNTLWNTSGHRLSTAHPRSRGEHAGAVAAAIALAGSSPLARGTL